jgi:hypothetical protein
MYYIWEHEDFDLNLFSAHIPKSNPWLKFIIQYFDKSNIILNKTPNVPCELVTGRYKKDYLFTDFIFIPYLGFKIISEKLKKILEETKIDKVQFFPIIIKYRSQKKYIGGYYMINCCNYIPAINLNHSIYQKNKMGHLYNFKKIVLDEFNIPKGTKLFLPKNTYIYVIHEDLKNTFEKENISGIKYIQINK